MPIYSLTLEQKEKLLKERGNVETQLKNLKKKTPNDLWKSDIEDFITELDKFEKELEKNTAEADAKVGVQRFLFRIFSIFGQKSV